MATGPSQSSRIADFKQGQYSDGSPLDEVQYLECKLILKPDRFTAAKVFLEYGQLVAQTAKQFGIGYIDKGVVLKPAIREVMFLDTGDFRLYNNAFILRRRIRYRDGFPAGDPEIVFKYRHPDIQKAAELDVRPNIAGNYRIKFKAETLPLKDQVGGYRNSVLSQRAVSAEPGARGGSHLDANLSACIPGLRGAKDFRQRQGRTGERDNRRGGPPGPR